MRLYYVTWYRLSNADAYLIWYSNDSHGVFVDAEGYVPSFRNVGALRTFTDKLGMGLEDEEPGLHDFDVVKRWLDEPKTSTVNCVEFLNAWNLFVDIARSTNDNIAHIFLDKEDGGDKLYDKLFWGNNLPSMTPEGRTYIPLWPNDQIVQMQEILANGLKMFEQSILVYS